MWTRESVRVAYRPDQLSMQHLLPSLSALPIFHACVPMQHGFAWLWVDCDELTLTIPLRHHRKRDVKWEAVLMCYVIGLQPHSVCLCSSAQKWTDGVERTWLKIQNTNNAKAWLVVFNVVPPGWHTIECSQKHLKRSLLDVVFITYNLTVVISPNPTRSTISPACVLVWCNIYKHFSTKVTCAEVTGLQPALILVHVLSGGFRVLIWHHVH